MSAAPAYAITLADVQDAAACIGSDAHRTPVHTSQHMDTLAGKQLFFKAECLQRTGSFKIRGALNAVRKAKDANVIVTHSSGNHAQAIALAATSSGKKAQIVMPDNSPACKIEAVRGYGADITFCPPRMDARLAAAERLISEAADGAILIPSYNHPHVMAGQGTVALELLEQVPDLDALVVPVGGGGLISGITVAAKALKPGIRVFAAEPAMADDCKRSFVAKQWMGHNDLPNTVADGLRTATGDLTWPIIRDLVDDVITVSEEDIMAATKLVWQRMKLFIEPSAGVPTAVAIGDELKRLAPDLKRVGVILCGGNVDLDMLKAGGYL